MSGSLSTSIVSWAGPRPERAPLYIVSVADLKFSADGMVATLDYNGRTYDVLKPDLMTVANLVKLAKTSTDDDDMNAWVLEDAFEAGIRVEFGPDIDSPEWWAYRLAAHNKAKADYIRS